MSSSNEISDESMPTFNSVVEGSQTASLDKSLSPIESESSALEPEAPALEPEAPAPEPEAPAPEPEAPTPKPEVASPDSEVPATEPEVASPESEVPAPEPEVASEESIEEETGPSVVGEPLEEPVVSESKQMDKDKKMVDEAATFRRKLTNTKKRLPTMDDHQKDEIRNGVINEFINILKISKRATTRKKLGRRINNLRNVFNETLDLLNGTAKKHPKRRKTKKQNLSEVPPAETFSENQY